METMEFLRRHPRLFHLAHGDAWPSLREHGLLTTKSLVQRSDLDATDQETLLTQHRPAAVTLPVPGLSSVVLRDQGPGDMAMLGSALTGGMSVAEWLGQLSSMVFLFPDEATLSALYAKDKLEPAVVVELDARRLVDEYGALIRLASINTRATVHKSASRGRETFQGIRQFDAKRKVKEVAVLDDIPDLAKHVRKAERWDPDGARTALS